MKSIALFIAAAACFLFLTGCVTYPISPALLAEAQTDLTVPAVLQNPQEYTGRVVVWGGIIVATTNQQQNTEITVRETPLTSWEEPVGGDFSYGRFIAKYDGFLDPSVYAPGLKLTVAGPIAGEENSTINGQPYTYVILNASQVYLWTVNGHYLYPPYYYYYRPRFHGYFGPSYGFGVPYGPHFVPDRGYHPLPNGPSTVQPFRGPEAVNPAHPGGVNIQPFRGPGMANPGQPGTAKALPFQGNGDQSHFQGSTGNNSTGARGTLHRRWPNDNK
jgi:outer membrane lipoprotein